MKKEDFIYLIYKEYRGMITAAELEQLEFWLSASLENQKVKSDILESMDMLNAYEPNFDVDVEEDYGNILKQLTKSESSKQVEQKSETKVFSINRWLYAAATVVVLIGAFSIFSEKGNQEVNWKMTSTSSNMTKEIKLDDGSVITLNENSSLTYPIHFGGGQRMVKLDGEAFFEVAKDQSRTFVIETNNTVTSVLGTSFNIDASKDNSRTSILVHSGKVKFESKSGSNNVILNKYDTAVLNHQANVIAEGEVTDFNSIAWKTNKLSFKSKSLSEIFSFLEDFFDVTLDTKAVNTLDCKFTMTPTNDNLEQILNGIKGPNKIVIRKESNKRYILSGGEC